MHLDNKLISENRTKQPVVILAELHRNNINMHYRTIANDLIAIKELHKTHEPTYVNETVIEKDATLRLKLDSSGYI